MNASINPIEDGGSKPAPPLQDFLIEKCSAADVREFIERHHYSHSIKGVTPSYCFKVTLDGQLVGAAIFGLPGMRETLEKYSEFGQYELLELRRFVAVDDTPRNFESFCLGVMLRKLRQYGIQRILSYADPSHGHVGTIYKAVGFEFLGQTPACAVIIYDNQRLRRRSSERQPQVVQRSSLDRHRRIKFANRAKDQFRKFSTRQINKFGNYQDKDAGLLPFAQEIREALATGKAYRKKEAGKFIYLKNL
jgi:hypothetical protein